MFMLRALTAFALIGSSVLLAASACAYQFVAPHKKLVLPNGYYELYVDGQRTSGPRYIDFALNTKGIDNGYIYCLGIERGGKAECLENLDEILTDRQINPVVLDGKQNTYFMFKTPDASMDMLISIVKQYVQDNAVRLRLLQYVGSAPVDLCKQPENELAVALKRFEVRYRIEHAVTENAIGQPVITAKAVFDNPDATGMVVADMFGSEKRRIATVNGEMPLTVSKNNSAGFCLSVEASPDDPNLKHESDYFCRTISLDKEVDKKQLQQMLTAGRTTHVQLARCDKDAKRCEQPHLVLGASAASRLQKAGYGIQTLSRAEGAVLVAGPFAEAEVDKELAKIQQIVASATRLGAAAPRTQPVAPPAAPAGAAPKGN